MEFFTIQCPGKGDVWMDGKRQGGNVRHSSLFKFQCGDGTHKISMKCLIGKQCQEPEQQVLITETNPIEPQEVPFTCAL